LNRDEQKEGDGTENYICTNPNPTDRRDNFGNHP
jgi:hypothetical protein